MNPQAIGFFLVTTIDLFIMLLIARILLSWFPAIHWHEQPWAGLHSVTDVALKPFRRWIPSFGGMDFSPIVLFVLLNILQGVISQAFGVHSKLPF